MILLLLYNNSNNNSNNEFCQNIIWGGKDVSKCIENDMLELDFIQRENVFTKII